MDTQWINLWKINFKKEKEKEMFTTQEIRNQEKEIEQIKLKIKLLEEEIVPLHLRILAWLRNLLKR